MNDNILTISPRKEYSTIKQEIANNDRRRGNIVKDNKGQVTELELKNMQIMTKSQINHP